MPSRLLKLAYCVIVDLSIVLHKLEAKPNNIIGLGKI